MSYEHPKNEKIFKNIKNKLVHNFIYYNNLKMREASPWVGILFFLLIGGVCFAQLSPGQILRSEEMLEKEKVLRERFEKEEKVYIKRIIVEGVTLLSSEEIEEIILPYQKHWLTQQDIQKIQEAIKEAYIQKGLQEKLSMISYRIQRKTLIIEIKEISP